MSYKHPYMNLIMTPPQQEQEQYAVSVPRTSSMSIVSEAKGLGQVVGESENGPWGMSVSAIAISAIVISALAFMALCVVSMSRRR